MALTELHDNICTLQDRHPEALYVVGGDYNHGDLKDILPRFHQQVKVIFLTVCTQTGRRHIKSPAPSLACLTIFQSCWSLSIGATVGATVQAAYTITVPQDCFEHTKWHIREASTV